MYDLWRPIVAIRFEDPFNGDYDGNPLTTADKDWTPLGAPGSNGMCGDDFTPPFPAYTSGPATFGAAAFRVLAHLYGDDTPFNFMSDEMNGITRDSRGHVWPARVCHFDNAGEG